MQNKKLKHEYVLISVPAELLLEAGIFEGEIMEMYVADKKLIIQNADAVEPFVCGGDCEHCIMNGMDCDGECEDCPCSGSCDESEAE